MTLAATLVTDPAWSQAACVGLDPEWFYPERGESTKQAKAVCASCAIRRECLDFAIANIERFGIWGGTSERQRRRIRRNRLPLVDLTNEYDNDEPDDEDEEETVELDVTDTRPVVTIDLEPPSTNGTKTAACEECGRAYIRARRDQRFCSKECRQAKNKNKGKATATPKRRGRPPKSPPRVVPAATVGTVEGPTPPASTATLGGAPDAPARQLAIDLLGLLLDARSNGSRETDEQVNALAGRLALQVIAA